MTIQQYTDTFWFPSGVLAANVSASVFPRGSSALASLWTDATGTVALPNPLPTNGSGVLTFWAESGDYWVHINAETIPVTVGMSQEAADLSTGLASGGELNVNGSNPKALDIGPLDGYVMTYVGTQVEPTLVRVKTAAQTVVLDAAAQLRQFTWWLIDSSGTVIQQATEPTNTQYRSHLVLGYTDYDGSAIIAEQTLPVILHHPANQFVDLLKALGPFQTEHSTVGPDGSNLTIVQTSGTLFSRASNYFAGPVQTNDPHITPILAQNPAQFRYVTRSSSTISSLVSNVDVANYDVGGVITPIGGGANSSTIQRVWCFASNTAANQLVIQYGQTVYASLAAARAKIGSTGHVVNPALPGKAALLAYIVAIRTATDLSDTAQCEIVDAPRFAIP